MVMATMGLTFTRENHRKSLELTSSNDNQRCKMYLTRMLFEDASNALEDDSQAIA